MGEGINFTLPLGKLNKIVKEIDTAGLTALRNTIEQEDRVESRMRGPIMAKLTKVIKRRSDFGQEAEAAYNLEGEKVNDSITWRMPGENGKTNSDNSDNSSGFYLFPSQLLVFCLFVLS